VLGYLALSTCKRKLRSSICSLQRSSDEIGTDEIGTDHMARTTWHEPHGTDNSITGSWSLILTRGTVPLRGPPKKAWRNGPV
jgi:hypothetical protein